MLEAPNPNFQIPGKSQALTKSYQTTDNPDGTDREENCRANPLQGRRCGCPYILFCAHIAPTLLALKTRTIRALLSLIPGQSLVAFGALDLRFTAAGSVHGLK
jgi:hypothetical protein